MYDKIHYNKKIIIIKKKQTKVHTFKAMVFTVVMYEYENWTIKKVGC